MIKSFIPKIQTVNTLCKEEKKALKIIRQRILGYMENENLEKAEVEFSGRKTCNIQKEDRKQEVYKEVSSLLWDTCLEVCGGSAQERVENFRRIIEDRWLLWYDLITDLLIYLKWIKMENKFVPLTQEIDDSDLRYKISKIASDNKESLWIKKLGTDIREKPYREDKEKGVVYSKREIANFGANVIRKYILDEKFHGIYVNASENSFAFDKIEDILSMKNNKMGNQFTWEEQWIIEKMTGVNFTIALLELFIQIRGLTPKSIPDKYIEAVVKHCFQMKGNYSRTAYIYEYSKSVAQKGTIMERDWKNFNELYERVLNLFAEKWKTMWTGDGENAIMSLEFARDAVLPLVEYQDDNMILYCQTVEWDLAKYKASTNKSIFVKTWKSVINNIK